MVVNEFNGRTIITPNQHHPNQIQVVGCGGIGARIVATLVKMLPADQPTTLHLWDFDLVEPKNLLRQHFALPDLGINKAEALADRYSTPMLDIQAHPTRWQGEPVGGNITILAVDNHQPRVQALANAGSLGAIIDCGNDGDRGQVLLGGQLDGWPLNIHATHFPELLKEAPPQPCDALDTQTVIANQMAATLALSYVEALLKGQAFSHCGLMFVLPHGVWEIPIRSRMAKIGSRTKVLMPLKGWNKGIANTYRTGDNLPGDPLEEAEERKLLVGEMRSQWAREGALINCHCKFCNGMKRTVMERLGVQDEWLDPEHLLVLKGEAGFDQNDKTKQLDWDTRRNEELKINEYFLKERVVPDGGAEAQAGQDAAGPDAHSPTAGQGTLGPVFDGLDEDDDSGYIRDCDCADCRRHRGEIT